MKRVLVSVVGLWLVGLGTGVAPAQEPVVDPSLNQQYEEPEFERWVRIFERPGREVYDRRHAIIDALALRQGMDVADIGAGTGLFTKLIAPAVGPSGTVYAVDISQVFIDNIERIAAERALDNVKGVVNTQKRVGLPEQSIDLAFICATYHHFEHPVILMRSVHAALRPGGTVVVIDFRKHPEVASDWVRGHVRARRGHVIDEIESAGFELVDEQSFLQRNYFLRFRKVDAGER